MLSCLLYVSIAANPFFLTTQLLLSKPSESLYILNDATFSSSAKIIITSMSITFILVLFLHRVIKANLFPVSTGDIYLAYHWLLLSSGYFLLIIKTIFAVIYYLTVPYLFHATP